MKKVRELIEALKVSAEGTGCKKTIAVLDALADEVEKLGKEKKKK